VHLQVPKPGWWLLSFRRRHNKSRCGATRGGLGLLPLVRHFEVRLDFVGAFGHAVEEALLDSLVDAEADEFYLVRRFFLERLLERQ
jgi:hypothetical protein